jgi:hypothetical protein
MSSVAAPLFLATSAMSAMGQMRTGRAERELYDAKAADAIMKGRSEAIAYKQQGADVLARLNDNLAAVIARSAKGGGAAYTIATANTAEAAREFHTSADNAVLAKNQAAIQADQYRMAGDAAMTTARYNAFSTIGSAIFKFGQL